MFNRIKNKFKKIKARKKVAEGKIHHKGWKKDQLQEYWRKQSKNDENDPEGYIHAENNRAEYLLDLIKKLELEPEESILELGMSSGKVFSHIYNNGYHNLTGIEINSEAIEIMKKAFPKVAKNTELIKLSLEDALPSIPDGKFSLVYSMAVLESVHPESNFIFEHIARISKKYIITIETEFSVSPRHYPRDYKKIFKNLGFNQRFFEMTEGKIKNYPNHHCRVFEKSRT